MRNMRKLKKFLKANADRFTMCKLTEERYVTLSITAATDEIADDVDQQLELYDLVDELTDGKFKIFFTNGMNGYDISSESDKIIFRAKNS